MPTATDLAGNAVDGDGNGTGGDTFAVAGNATNRLYQLAAEWSGDEAISVFDFSTFSYWFGSKTNVEPVAPAYVDLNDDQGISVFDFTAFSQNFGVEITYQTTFAATGSDDVTPTTDDDLTVQQAEVVAIQPWDSTSRKDDQALNDVQLRSPLEQSDEALEEVISALANDVAVVWG